MRRHGVAASLALTAMAIGPDGKCRILALRSGGAHGAFEVGALNAFVDGLPTEEVHWDYLSGVSVGAINASALATYGYGEEKEGVDAITKMYTEHDMGELWETYRTVVFPPFWQKSFVKNDGLRAQVAGVLEGRPFQRKLSVEAVDLVSGQVVIFDEQVMEEAEEGARRAEMVIASASIPAVFPPVPLDDMWLVDGGVFQALDIGYPVERCREEGVADSEIIVDIVLAFSSVVEVDAWTVADAEWKNAYSIWKRRTEISKYYNWYEDVLRLTRGYPHITFRHIVAPTQQVPSSGWVPINSTKEMLADEIAIGRADGERVIAEAREGGGSSLEGVLRRLRRLAEVESG